MLNEKGHSRMGGLSYCFFFCCGRRIWTPTTWSRGRTFTNYLSTL